MSEETRKAVRFSELLKRAVEATGGNAQIAELAVKDSAITRRPRYAVDVAWKDVCAADGAVIKHRCLVYDGGDFWQPRFPRVLNRCVVHPQTRYKTCMSLESLIGLAIKLRRGLMREAEWTVANSRRVDARDANRKRINEFHLGLTGALRASDLEAQAGEARIASIKCDDWSNPDASLRAIIRLVYNKIGITEVSFNCSSDVETAVRLRNHIDKFFHGGD